ncbi:MAG TPA: LuxR C-terminal-related transcriptional regulator [Solirubrobacteraceae bacterium]|jgi:DNA-binding CsgD family transcriptional regulator|nr:LuxR C-terminal-related transcriptional regulator [Solirubrobacteraceae bacterium]
MSSDPASAKTTTASPTKRLVGRRRERDALSQLLQSALGGTGGVLVVHGEAGVGKTALLDDTAETASGFRIVSAVGVEGEMEFPFAALHQLCSPILSFAERLPDIQREALAVAFGLSAGPAPDAYLIGLAVLGLLSEAAEERPLLCIVDDAQWLDPASSRSLTFAARRLLAEKIAFVFGARELDAALTALNSLHLQPLGQRDARDLLRSALPGRLDDRVLERIVVETRGNPLALLELPRGLTPAQLAGGFALPAALPFSAQIEESFTRRLAGLPVQARRLLLLASAEPTGDLALLWRAAQLQGIPESAGPLLESQSLLTLTSGVAFRHPLLRSAVYGAAQPDERREAHRVLAEAIDPELDPDRRAWHRAQATVTPDEDIAAELERAAARAQARGGPAAAAAFLERAAALTLDPVLRAQRGLAAARAKYEAGSLQDALALLAAAEDHCGDERQRALVELLKAQVALAARRGSDAPPMLLKAARALEPIDPQLARETYLEALDGGLFAGRLASDGGLVEISEAALGSPAPDTAGPKDLLLEGMALWFTDSYAAGAPILKEALRAFRDDSSPHVEARWLFLASWVAAELWDEETWMLLTENQLRRARAAGELTAVPPALGSRSIILAMSGELAAAASLADEQEAVTDAAAMAPTANGGLWLPAWAGRETELNELGRLVSSDAVARGEGYALAVIELASAVLYNGLGRYGEAMAAVRCAAEDAQDFTSPIAAVVELIEAAARCGERPLAERALERLLERTDVSQTAWARGAAARSRALLADSTDADGLYREAIGRLGETRLRVDLARAQLLYGEWLSGHGHRPDARDQLRKAHALFTELGTVAFAERARGELQAAGERAPHRAVQDGDGRDELTPQEAHIARLAADGNSNREIAAQLFISPSTVEYHLRKVFRKLEVKSRTQLAHQLNRQQPTRQPL